MSDDLAAVCPIIISAPAPLNLKHVLFGYMLQLVKQNDIMALRQETLVCRLSLGVALELLSLG